MTFAVPVLLLVWRRPHTLRQVIDAIRPVAPTHLYVACDGPNPERPGEAEKVAATRAVIEHEIDWPCQIERLYSDVNQGCRLGVSRAITWFFEQVEEGIILEDDCVPHPDFLYFCGELLERYRFDNRIFLITGHNKEGETPMTYDYFFSRLGGIWGWASWKRAWIENIPSISAIEESKRLGILQGLVSEDIATERYSKCLQSLNGQLDSWAYEWGFCRLVNGGLCCVPRFNLISNIGNDIDAVHTYGLDAEKLSNHRFAFPLSKPLFMAPLTSYDSLYEAPRLNLIQGLSKKTRNVIKRIFPLIALLKPRKLLTTLIIKANPKNMG